MVRFLLFERHTTGSGGGGVCGGAKDNSMKPCWDLSIQNLADGLYPAINRNYYNPTFFTAGQSMTIKPREDVIVIFDTTNKLFKYHGFADAITEKSAKQMMLKVTNLHYTKHVNVHDGMLLDHLLSHPFVDSHFCSASPSDSLEGTELFTTAHSDTLKCSDMTASIDHRGSGKVRRFTEAKNDNPHIISHDDSREAGGMETPLYSSPTHKTNSISYEIVY